MKKKALSLALALTLCLELTVPAFAVKTGDTTVTTKEGDVFSFSKPIVGTEQIKFNYELDTADMAGKDEQYSKGGMYFDKNLADETASEVTALLVSIGTVITTQNTGLCIVAEDKTHLLWMEEYNKAEFSSGELLGTDWKYDNYLDEQGETVWRCAYFKPGAVFYVSSYVVGESADEYTVTDTGHIFVKLVENTTSPVISDPGSTTPAEPETPAQPTTPSETKTANPTNDKLTVNGAAQNPTVYKIDGSNYFKIRDVAAVLNGTEKQFAVGYSGGKVTVTSGQPYEATGKELAGAPDSAKDASPSNDAIVIDGVETSLTVYKIGGSNYFKLRDLGEALNFYVGWEAGRGVYIETDKPYSK